MYAHAPQETESLRPKASRLAEQPDDQTLQAAATGRAELLGPAGILRMQRSAGNAAATALATDSPVLDVVADGGRPLDGPVLADMEARLGADFSDVRVHTDDRAHESAESVNARAYTVGSNVVFQRDAYDPSSTAGQTVLAHELTHVIQQRNGPVDGTPAADGLSISDPSDRFERAAANNAERAMAAPLPHLPESSGPASGPVSMQREAEDDNDDPAALTRNAVPMPEQDDEATP